MSSTPFSSAERAYLTEPDRLCQACLEHAATAPDGYCDGCAADKAEQQNERGNRP